MDQIANVLLKFLVCSSYFLWDKNLFSYSACKFHCLLFLNQWILSVYRWWCNFVVDWGFDYWDGGLFRILSKKFLNFFTLNFEKCKFALISNPHTKPIETFLTSANEKAKKKSKRHIRMWMQYEFISLWWRNETLFSS